MKPTLTPLSGFSIQDLELHNCDRNTEVLSQLKGEYEIDTTLLYITFLSILERKITKLLTSTWLTREQFSDLWEDQHIVREAIEQEYYEQQVP